MTVEEMLAKLAQETKNLHETITARFSSVHPDQKKVEEDALVEKVLDAMTKAGFRKAEPARKMAWNTPDAKPTDGVKLVTFGDFMKAINRRDMKWLEDAGVKTANGQSEGTNADGGFAVPTEYASEIIKLERQNSIARRIARLFPMGSLTRKIPRQLTNPTVTWTAEATNHTKTKATLEQITQTAKKVSALIPITEELLADNNVNLDQFLFQVVAEAIGREEDKVAFVGDVSGSSDPFNGVYFATGVNSVSMNGATLSWQDLVDLMMAPKAPYRARGQYVCSSTALKKIMKLVDDQNRPIWLAPQLGQPSGSILGKSYDETAEIPDTLGTTRANGTNTAILFGDFGRSLWLSDRGEYDVKASDSASDANGGAGSAFLQDEIWYKFRKREDITVAQPEAFAKLAVPV